MRIPTQAELTTAILNLRAAELISECFGADWYLRGDPRQTLPLTYAEFQAMALQLGIPKTVLVEGQWGGHEHYVIVERDGQWLMGYAEREQVALRGQYPTLNEARQAVIRELWQIYDSAANPSHKLGGLPAGSPFLMPHTLHYAPKFRRFSLFSLLLLFGIVGLGGLSYLESNDLLILVLLMPLLGIGLWWLFALATAPTQVHFGPTDLTIQRWVGTQTIAYLTIIAVRQSLGFITLQTTTGTVRLTKLYAHDDARLLTTLTKTVPVAIQARTQQLNAGFPIEHVSRIRVPIINCIIGCVLLGFGCFSVWYGLTSPTVPGQLPNPLIALAGVAFVCFGGLFFYLTLWAWPRYTRFTPTAMTQHYLLRTTEQPMTGVIDFHPGFEVRTVRGFERRLYHITFIYQNGATFRWAPNDFEFPMDYIDAAADDLTQTLTEQLRRAYLP